MSGLRSKTKSGHSIGEVFLKPETLDLRPFSLQPFAPLSASHYAAHTVCPRLTAYLLNVKVFVCLNPSILVTGTHPLPKGVKPQRCLCAILVLTPRNWEIGGAS